MPNNDPDCLKICFMKIMTGNKNILPDITLMPSMELMMTFESFILSTFLKFEIKEKALKISLGLHPELTLI